MEEEKKWYVVNTYSGHESKVKEKLDMRINSMEMQENIFRVIVPERKEVEIKDGKKKEKVKKLFPGYVLVEMIMSDESWYIVRNTPGVTGFLGSSGKGAKPIPLQDDEVERIFKEIGYTGENVVVNYEVGDNVKITDGPFKMLAGKIIDINLDAGKATVAIDLFGQETNVELELTQFTKE
jgi:transcriptional antiterminator NusG